MEVKIIDNTDKAKSQMADAIERAVEKLGLLGEGFAIDEVDKAVYDTPPSDSYVRTGALRNSITHRTDDTSAYIGSGIQYAPYVEYGTSKMKPRPFIKPAITEHISEYKEAIEQELKG